MYFFGEAGGGLGDYYREVTNLEVELVGQVFGWYDIGHSVDDLDALPSNATQRAQAFAWGIQAATSNGAPLAGFPNQVVIINYPSDHGALGAGRMLIAHGNGAVLNHVFMQHEFGHVLGLQHSWLYQSNAPPIEYGDPYCIMSAFTRGYPYNLNVLGYPAPAGPSPNAVYLNQLGGLANGRLQQVAGVVAGHNVDIWLSALGSGVAGVPQVAQVLPAGSRANTLYLEVRHQSRWDSGIPKSCVVLHETAPGDGRSYLIAGPKAWGLQDPRDSVVSSDGSVRVVLLEMDEPGMRAQVEIQGVLMRGGVQLGPVRKL